MALIDTIRKNEVIPVTHQQPLIVNLRVAKTPSFYEYVDNKPARAGDPDNIFGSKESTIGLYLAQKLLPLCGNSSVYQTNLVLYLGNLERPDILHITNLLCSTSVLALSNIYPDPKVLINIYNPPSDEVIIYQRHWQMCWFAHLRRCLGELYKPHISRYNREWRVKDLQKGFEADPRFNWESINNNIKYGYQFYRSRLTARNFCEGTAGDLYS